MLRNSICPPLRTTICLPLATGMIDCVGIMMARSSLPRMILTLAKLPGTRNLSAPRISARTVRFRVVWSTLLSRALTIALYWLPEPSTLKRMSRPVLSSELYFSGTLNSRRSLSISLMVVRILAGLIYAPGLTRLSPILPLYGARISVRAMLTSVSSISASRLLTAKRLRS